MPPHHPLLRTEALRALEQGAAAGLPPGTLMTRAGQAAAEWATRIGSDRPGPIWVLAGPGNNGGDALVTAAGLRRHGHQVELALLADPSHYQGDAAAAWQRWQGPVRHNLDGIEHAAMIIDGLYGIGLNRPLPTRAAAWVDRVNQHREASGRQPHPCPVLALDVPSGLQADTGALAGAQAIRATHTITFLADKPGLHTLDGPDHAGTVEVASLGVSIPDGPGLLNHPDLFAPAARPRPRNTHKGLYGNCAVLGGQHGMVGAALLAGRAALHAGAGRVTLQLLASDAPLVDPVQPELMLRRQGDDSPIDALVAGPGLGTDPDARAALGRALPREAPLVLDADALNLIATDPALALGLRARAEATILTPHPLEAARLLHTDVGTVQSDRIAAALALAQAHGACVILKGAGSVIATPDGRWVINPTGNAGLSTAGTGDVLAGLLGALLAQGWSARAAALGATWLHGHAADQLVQAGIGPIGMVAGELIPALRRALNALTRRPLH